MADAHRGVIFTFKARTDASVGGESARMSEIAMEAQKRFDAIHFDPLHAGKFETSLTRLSESYQQHVSRMNGKKIAPKADTSGWKALSAAGKEALDNQKRWAAGVEKLNAQRAANAKAAADAEIRQINRVQKERLKDLRREVKSDKDSWKDFEKFGQRSKSDRLKKEKEEQRQREHDQRADDRQSLIDRRRAEREEKQHPTTGMAGLSAIGREAIKQNRTGDRSGNDRFQRGLQNIHQQREQERAEADKQRAADQRRAEREARQQAAQARQQAAHARQQAAEQDQWDLILGGRPRGGPASTGTAGMRSATRRDISDPFGLADYQQGQQRERRRQEQAEQRERRDAEIALARQRESYSRLGESIGSTTDAVTRLAEGMAYLGLIGERDLGRLSDSLLAIRGTVDTIRGGVGTMRDLGGLIRSVREVRHVGGVGGIGRAIMGMGPAARTIVPLAGTGAAGATTTVAAGTGGSGISATGGVVGAGAAAVAAPVGLIAAAAASVATALASAGMVIREAAAVGGIGRGARVGGAVDRIASAEVNFGTRIASGGLSILRPIASAFTPYGLGPRESEDFQNKAFHRFANDPMIDTLSFGLFRNAMSNRITETKERRAAEDKAEREAQAERARNDIERQQRIRQLDFEQDRMRINETFRPRVGVSQLTNLGLGRGGIDAQLAIARQEQAALEHDYQRERVNTKGNQSGKLDPAREFEYDQRRLEIGKQIYDFETKRRDLARQELDLDRNRYELGRNEKGQFARMNPIEQQRVLDVYRRGKSGQQLNELDLRLLESSGISRFGEIAASQREKQSQAMFQARGGTASEAEDIFGQRGYQHQEERKLQRERQAIGSRLYEEANRQVETPMRPTGNADEEQRQRRDQFRQEFQQVTARLNVENKVVIEAGKSLSEVVDRQWTQFLDNQNRRFEELIKSLDERAEQRLAATRSRINQQGRMLA